jgi:hypothetical protein
MKVVCIDTDITNKLGGAPTLKLEEPLEYGKVYEGELIFNIDGKTYWEKNYLNLDGWSELEWFPTENFTTLDIWREKILSEIL